MQPLLSQKKKLMFSLKKKKKKSDNTDNRSQKPTVNKQLQQPTRATDGKHFKHSVKHGVDEL